MGTRNGFVASEKGAAAETQCDVEPLALRMQATTNNNKSFSRKKKMMMMMVDTTHHQDHHDGGGDNHDDHDHDESTNLVTPGRGRVGFGEEEEEEVHACEAGHSSSLQFPFNNNNQQVVVASMSDIYDVVGSTHHHSTQLFMPLPPKSLLFPESLISHYSSGVMVNSANNFTAAQRQELERQTMIYKYMMASLPVPPQLLIPISKTTSNFPHFNSNRSKGSLELGVSNSTDPEPWRCRRTDGKKWRCSRNVVPDQKYCERHSHKSRPRSRKPVEQQQKLLNSQFFNNNSNANFPYSKPSNFLDQREKHHSHDNQTRAVEWFMKEEEAKYSNQEWNKNSSNVSHTKPQNEIGFGYCNNQVQGGLQSQGLNEQLISSLIEPKFAVPTNQTRHFIDAWSTAETDHQRDHIINMGGEIGGRSTNNDNKYAVVSSNDKVFPYSSLTLSMHNNNSSTEEESENSQMGFVFEKGGDNNLKSQWMNYNVNSVSWNVNGSTSPPTPTPGGPLAEALCLGMAGSTRPTTSSRSSS